MHPALTISLENLRSHATTIPPLKRLVKLNQKERDGEATASSTKPHSRSNSIASGNNPPVTLTKLESILLNSTTPTFTRSSTLQIATPNILLDLTLQRLEPKTLSLLFDLSAALRLRKSIDSIPRGTSIDNIGNFVALRSVAAATTTGRTVSFLSPHNKNLTPGIEKSLSRVNALSASFRSRATTTESQLPTTAVSSSPSNVVLLCPEGTISYGAEFVDRALSSMNGSGGTLHCVRIIEDIQRLKTTATARGVGLDHTNTFVVAVISSNSHMGDDEGWEMLRLGLEWYTSGIKGLKKQQKAIELGVTVCAGGWSDEDAGDDKSGSKPEIGVGPYKITGDRILPIYPYKTSSHTPQTLSLSTLLSLSLLHPPSLIRGVLIGSNSVDVRVVDGGEMRRCQSVILGMVDLWNSVFQRRDLSSSILVNDPSSGREILPQLFKAIDIEAGITEWKAPPSGGATTDFDGDMSVMSGVSALTGGTAMGNQGVKPCEVN